ncbi:phosphoribosylglycinamide formyltransferase [Candidatus Peregrinibacteria bacterium]|nr:phosphoribosylglycinamide formyltransferase [Candidatus Peregrinibacteria bacterium]
MNFIVLCSSNGTTFHAVLDRIADESLTAKCLGLITDSGERGCIEKAKRAGVPVQVVEKKKSESREEYDKKLHKMIQGDIYIACMGWMHIFSPWFIRQFQNRILNVHPALLPKYGGKGMYGIKVHEEVLRHKEKESGMTIHMVTEQVDEGPILLQKKCPVLPDDTPETLQKRVQELEKEWYPKILQNIEEGTIQPPI